VGEIEELYSCVSEGHWPSPNKVHACERPRASLWAVAVIVYSDDRPEYGYAIAAYVDGRPDYYKATVLNPSAGHETQ